MKETKEQDCVKLIKKECDALKELLVKKNNSYGNSAFEVPVVMPRIAPFGAIMVRLSDKVKRLQYLLDSDVYIECFGESVLDTLQDLAGYSILAQIAWKKNCSKVQKRGENGNEEK